MLPVPDERVIPGDPAEMAAGRETIRLAFVAALQHLPPKQRAVLILREVLRWQATEVAELLDTSVASVNSALQRARATLDALDLDATRAPAARRRAAGAARALRRRLRALRRRVARELIHEDATFSMPPYQLWLRARAGRRLDARHRQRLPGARLLTTTANGCPAVAIYRRPRTALWKPFNLAVLEIERRADHDDPELPLPRALPRVRAAAARLTASSSTA